jgi:hypothetical protein
MMALLIHFFLRIKAKTTDSLNEKHSKVQTYQSKPRISEGFDQVWQE